MGNNNVFVYIVTRDDKHYSIHRRTGTSAYVRDLNDMGRANYWLVKAFEVEPGNAISVMQACENAIPQLEACVDNSGTKKSLLADLGALVQELQKPIKPL